MEVVKLSFYDILYDIVLYKENLNNPNRSYKKCKKGKV